MHKFNRVRQVAPMCPYGRTRCRHLSNNIEPSVLGGDAPYGKLLRPLVIFGHAHCKPNYITLAGSKLVQSWFEAGSKLVADPGSKLVADLQRAEIWPIIYLASSELARTVDRDQIPLPYLVRSWFGTGSKLAADQLRTCLRPASNQLRTR